MGQGVGRATHHIGRTPGHAGPGGLIVRGYGYEAAHLGPA